MRAQRHRIKAENFLVVAVGLLLTLALAGPSSAFTWSTNTVDSVHPDGGNTSIAVDSTGLPHISYYEANGNDLKYARRLCTPMCTWSIETVAAGGDVGRYNSIALDAHNNPHISYEAGSALKYARGRCPQVGFDSKCAWEIIDTVDSTTDIDVGQTPSIAVGSNDRPHISYYRYYNTSNDELRYTQGSGAP
jgi:hypothetical protein